MHLPIGLTGPYGTRQKLWKCNEMIGNHEDVCSSIQAMSTHFLKSVQKDPKLVPDIFRTSARTTAKLLPQIFPIIFLKHPTYLPRTSQSCPNHLPNMSPKPSKHVQTQTVLLSFLFLVRELSTPPYCNEKPYYLALSSSLKGPIQP